MSHSIFGERCYSYREVPWHQLGVQGLMRIGAVEALQQIGSYEVVGQPIYTPVTNADGSRSYLQITGKQAVLRLPTTDDPEIRQFDLIDINKEIIGPSDLAEIWDRSTQRYVETIGGLGHGEKFFITTKLQTFGVKGEEIQQYLLVHMDYRGTLKVSIVTVRVVCINTLTAAENSALEVHPIDLTKSPRTQLEIILTDLPARKEQEAATLQEVFEVLKSTPVTPEQHGGIVEAAFPLPSLPKLTGIREEDEERHGHFVKSRQLALDWRQAVNDLAEGHAAGRGLADLPPSAWRSYNAVVEAIDWGGPNTKAETFFTSLLDGGRRAAVKSRAWTKAMEAVNAG